jgi:hypothetical protein
MKTAAQDARGGWRMTLRMDGHLRATSSSLRMSALLTALLVSAGLFAPVAQAHDHSAPKAALYTDLGTQRGLPVHSVWWRAVGAETCDRLDRFAIPAFPDAVAARGALDAQVRLRKAAAPRTVSALAWQRLDGEGRPKGRRTEVPVLLQPHLKAGAIIAWDGLLLLPESRRPDFYLFVEAHWGDEEGCGSATDPAGNQSASWIFHLRTRG